MKHIIFQYQFDELLAGLQAEVEKGYIAKREFDGLTLFNYLPSCQFDKAWNDFSLVARGLILHLPSQKIIALPFPKFFNYGEMSYDLPEVPFTISEKMDGSLGIIYFWNGQWHVATRGAFISDQAQWAKNWLHQNIKQELLNESHTYLAEIIYPGNRIVVSYDFAGLVLLSAFSLENGEESDTETLDTLAVKAGFKRPATFDHSFDELLEIAKSLSANNEGFVVRFQNGFRLKIKGEEYCRVHRLISEVTPLGVWRVLLANDNLDAIKTKLPEEYLHDFNRLVFLLSAQFNEILTEVKKAYELTKEWTDKEVGLAIQKQPGRFHEKAKPFLFTARKKQFFEKVTKPGLLRQKVFKTFRPTGNKLEGYDPTTAIDRFVIETDA